MSLCNSVAAMALPSTGMVAQYTSVSLAAQKKSAPAEARDEWNLPLRDILRRNLLGEKSKAGISQIQSIRL